MLTVGDRELIASDLRVRDRSEFVWTESAIETRLDMSFIRLLILQSNRGETICLNVLDL